MRQHVNDDSKMRSVFFEARCKLDNYSLTQGADMFTSRSDADSSEAGTADVLIPLIRAAATISFAIAPCSLGFVIIAASEQLIRSIMVGDDPERLVSDLENQFPNEAIEVDDNYDAGLIAKVVDLIGRPRQAMDVPLDIRNRSHGCTGVRGRSMAGYPRVDAAELDQRAVAASVHLARNFVQTLPKTKPKLKRSKAKPTDSP
jgi:hypothetical protein